MTLVVRYPSKKILKENIGNRLKYLETSVFGTEYKDDGEFVVANRPHITKLGKEFFAVVTMQNGRIAKVK